MMEARDIEDIYELSPLQQGILFHSLYDGDADIYLNQRSFLIDGLLDTEIVLRAWQQTVASHTALRTTFHWDGLEKPLQVVHREVPLDVTRYDWSGEPDRQERFERLLADDLKAGFDLARPPLQRLHLVRLAEDRHGFVWTHHLLLLDGWSVPIFLNDFMARYQSLAAGLPPPPPAPPYRDYIAWLQQQDLGAARDFWIRTMGTRTDAEPLGPLLPADPQRGPGPLDERVTSLSSSVEEDLRALAAKHRVTLNTVLHAAWAIVLQRYSGDTTVTYGVTSSCRPPEVSDIDRMVGLFTNTLPVRIRVPRDGDLGAWLRDVQATYAAVRRYEYSPLAKVKQWIGAPGPDPLFHSLVVFDNYSLAVATGDLGQQLAIRPLEAIEKTSQPLVASVTPGRELVLRARFHRDRFVPGSVEEMLACFRSTLQALARGGSVADVASVEVTEPARADTTVAFPDAGSSLPELVARQCLASPDAVAVVADEGTLTYRELWDRARQVAVALGAGGTGPGRVVGVCAEPSVEQVVALLGTLLAGAAYLPLEPSLPAARLAFMVSDSGVDVVLAQRAAVEVARSVGAQQVVVLEDVPRTAVDHTCPPLTGADAAYVIYTSGSTGRPKGVVNTHEAIVNRLLWMQETFELAPDDRVLQKTPAGFDVSVWEFFWPLLAGATMVVIRPGGHQDAEYLATTMSRQSVTTAHFVPSMLQLFLDEPAATDLPALRRVVCSGEQLPCSLAQRFTSLLPDVELHNLYGPTEAAVDVTWWDCARRAPSGVLPIGDVIANTQAHVLDDRLAEVPGNVPGELYLGGIQLARGYVGRPALTASTFVAHPLAGPGARLYRTGDKVRRLSDGSLEFLGRFDHQVKIHGYRIELGEIEQALRRHPSVKEAVVVARERVDDQQLAAYVTGVEDLEPRTLRGHLQQELPVSMLPATFTVLPSMPLSHNGKLDRSALPDPSGVSTKRGKSVAPASPRENAIAVVFGEVLGLADVDVTASFFDLGGTSFDAVRAIRRIEGATVGLLGAHSSVRELAAVLEGQESADRTLLRMTDAGSASHTLVCVPFGGGSAITYQQLARALPTDVELLALTVPGHELGGSPELRPLEDVAKEAAEAVLQVVEGPLSVYGHCAGVGLAVELVRQLEAAHRHVDRLFLAGAYPFYEPGRLGRTLRRGVTALIRAGFMKVSANTVGTMPAGDAAVDEAEMRYLKSIGGFDGVVDGDELAFVMRAFRHDVTDAERYFTEQWHPRRETRPLTAPITFIAGTDDPLTSGYEERHRVWERFGAGVELTTVPGGGHYFHQEQPETVSRILGRTCSVASGGEDTALAR